MIMKMYTSYVMYFKLFFEKICMLMKILSRVCHFKIILSNHDKILRI